MAAPQTIVVIGAGVIGLTCAVKLQAMLMEADAARRTEILIVAKEWPAATPGAPASHSVNYASMWAGAHVRPIPASTPQLRREAKWLKQTAAEFGRLVETEPWAGVTKTGGVEYLEAPGKDYSSQTKETFEAETGLSGFRRLDKSELPENVNLGIEYDTYCVNPPIYCLNLLRKFVLQGGKTLRRDLRNEQEAFSLWPNVAFVVNASGVGFGDVKSFPTRGQTVVTDISNITKTVTRQNKDGSWHFLIPRSYNGGTIVGGTKEPSDWHTEPRPESREALLRGGKILIPHGRNKSHMTAVEGHSDSDIRVVADIVGRRPTREGGMRIEVEELDLQQDGNVKGKVIHAYGAGGRGYEISCGVADEVLELATSLWKASRTRHTSKL